MFPSHVTRLITLALVAGAIAAAPAAASAYPAWPDMHASTAIAAAEERTQDLRSADARDAAFRAEQQAQRPAQDLRSPDAVDAAAGRGTFSAPDVVVVKLTDPQALPIGDGLDWGDAGIGAGALFGLGLVALGGTLIVMQRRHTRPAVH